ncbi:MAG: fused MFS/spermidine synthase [Verrucomicrobiales bacterium]
MTLFGFTIFLSAFLLFQVQLIVAKHLLPWFGGAPSVWTTCQAFFQLALLGGYAYAHVLSRMRSQRRQGYIHLSLLVAAVVSVAGLATWGGEPLLAPEGMKPDGSKPPVPLLLGILVVCTGLPYFVLSTTGPLLQRWHSRQADSLDRTYRLYALSNAGSFLGLLAYPFGIEWLLDLPHQAWLWAILFFLFAIGCGVVAWRAARIPNDEAALSSRAADQHANADSETLSVSTGAFLPWLWLLLAFTTSAMFLATTNQLCQDVASVPFLWVLPLAVYLLTFVLCFDHPKWYSRRWTVIVASIASIAILPASIAGFRISHQVVAYCVFLLLFCMACHGELVRLRPGPSKLTLFYLLIALGGALGGAFVSFAVPLLFVDLWEFHAMVVFGWLVILCTWLVDRNSPLHTGDRWLFAGFTAVITLLGLTFLLERTRVGQIDWMARNGWPMILLVGSVLTALACSVMWKTRLARSTFWPQALVLLVILMAGKFLWERIGASQARSLLSARNFYGVIRVTELRSWETGLTNARQMVHGTTMHGVQLTEPLLRKEPTAYYSPSSGVAVASRYLTRAPEGAGAGEKPKSVHFGIVGMGVGTMAAFVRPGDRIRLYEINPAVIEISQGDNPLFTFIKDCPGEVAIVQGDARLLLERELAATGSQGFDLLTMDAFSGDAVPVHLITEEVFRVYAAHLKDADSILAVNVTNRFLDLEPVIAANARKLGFRGMRFDAPGEGLTPQESSWILLTRNPEVFEAPSILAAHPKPLSERSVPFTDSYSNLFRVLD